MDPSGISIPALIKFAEEQTQKSGKNGQSVKLGDIIKGLTGLANPEPKTSISTDDLKTQAVAVMEIVKNVRDNLPDNPDTESEFKLIDDSILKIESDEVPLGEKFELIQDITAEILKIQKTKRLEKLGIKTRKRENMEKFSPDDANHYIYLNRMRANCQSCIDDTEYFLSRSKDTDSKIIAKDCIKNYTSGIDRFDEAENRLFRKYPKLKWVPNIDNPEKLERYKPESTLEISAFISSIAGMLV